MKTMNRMLSAAAALWLPIAHAADLPEVKEGLWSVHTQSIDNPGNKKSESTYTLCRNHGYDQAVQARSKNAKGCTTVSETFKDGKFSSDMHCVIAGSTVESKATTTFQGDTSFHSEAHATYNPPMRGIGEITMIIDQKYVGGCPTGAKPGDRTNPTVK